VRRDQIALQLYTVRTETQTDFLGTLRAVAEAGYPAVEFAGYGNLSAAELRRALDEYGLRAMGAHVQLDAFATRLPDVCAELQTLGAEFAIVPWLPPDRRGDVDQARWLAETFNEWGDRCREEGIRFGYHNHDFEFAPLPGEQPTTMFEILLTETDPKVVALELDVGWVQFVGADPLDLIRRHAERFPALHIKDLAPGEELKDVPVGDGIVDWPSILTAAEATSAWYIVEQDKPGDPLADSARSLRYLEGLAT
jgi:sugar phosphate isomerase/epimerase